MRLKVMHAQLGEQALDSEVQSALAYFLDYYRDHMLDYTVLYPGVREALDRLRAGSIPMAVLTNKPVHPSRAIVEALGLGGFFSRVYGGNSFPTKKPDPEGARSLLKETKTQPQQAVIIGDSSVDVLTGRNAGIWTCGVTYGFAPHTLCEAPPDVVVDRPHELAGLFA